MKRANSSLSESQRTTVAHLADILLPDGYDLPGASLMKVADALEAQVGAWDPTTRAGMRGMVTTWNLLPLASKFRSFNKLPPQAREQWVHDSVRSKSALKRQLYLALKQLIFLSWASMPEVEDALGFDYRCLRDNEVHGAGRDVIAAKSLWEYPEKPADYTRPGPAIDSLAISPERMKVETFTPVEPASLTSISWPDIGDGMTERTDVVVVGSGAGGAVVAATLAEAGMSVIVIEEGPQADTKNDFSGPVFRRFERLSRENATSLIWGRPPIPLPLGRVVGGTTVINSGTCFRAPDRVLERWATEYGVRDAGPEDLAPHYKDIEEFLNVRPVPWELLGANGMAAHKGAVALGYSGGPLLRNIADCHGCGQCAFGCPTDAKQAMHVSYLPRAQRAGARIFSRCRVERVLHENGKATGVTVSALGPDDKRRGTFRIDADHVVVSAGAVHTPGLLSDSGIPDPTGQTGRNLRIHPATGVAGFFDEGWSSWKGTLQSYYIDQFFDTHELMFEATTAVPGVAAGSVSGIGMEAMGELSDMSRMATLGFYVSDTSRGRVRRLKNGRTFVTYRLNALDTKRMGIGVAKAAEVLLAAGAKRVHVGLPGMKQVSSRSDLGELDRKVRPDHLRLTAFHPMGTVRMGSDAARSVVGPFGEHHQTERLWVADGSVFPSCVAVNPQMTIMVFAKRTAERIAALS